jgi:hypothetical protein
VIETKTRTHEGRHLIRVLEQARWLSRRRRRWCRRGAVAVGCLVRVRGVERREHGVIVVSIDRLTPALRSAAGMIGPRSVAAADRNVGCGACVPRCICCCARTGSELVMVCELEVVLGPLVLSRWGPWIAFGVDEDHDTGLVEGVLRTV